MSNTIELGYYKCIRFVIMTDLGVKIYFNSTQYNKHILYISTQQKSVHPKQIIFSEICLNLKMLNPKTRNPESTNKLQNPVNSKTIINSKTINPDLNHENISTYPAQPLMC